MVTVNDKMVDEFIDMANKRGIPYKSRGEARQAASNLVELVRVLMEQDLQDRRRKAKLKECPEGFELDEKHHRCHICDEVDVWHETPKYWYTKWGVIVCDECYKLRNNIPKVVFTGEQEQDWCDSRDIHYRYDLRWNTVNRMVKEGKLKPRDIVDANKKLRLRFFLRKDNPDIAEILKKEKATMAKHNR